MARKEKQFHYIYKTTNLLNGKYYYGMHSTDNLDDGYMGSGKRLRYSINKHGKENHVVEILEFLLNRSALAAREKEVVSLNEIAKEDCMNLMVGGEGGFVSDAHNKYRASCGGKARTEKMKNDPEFKEKCRILSSEIFKKAHKEGKFNYATFTGKKHTTESKKLISNK